MNFSEALNLLNAGGAVRRAGWNGKGLSVKIKKPETADSGMTLSYMYLEYPKGATVPWVPSQTDVLTEDWEQA